MKVKVNGKLTEVTYDEYRKAFDIVYRISEQEDTEEEKLAKQVVNSLSGKGLSEKYAVEILKRSIRIIEDLSSQHKLR